MPAGLPPLYILRHGETEWNREGRLQGHLDSPLTPQGLRQAEAQGDVLRRIRPRPARAIVSDSGRAVRTAEIALRGLDLPVTRDARLREVDLGAWQGLTPAEVAADWPWLVKDRTPEMWKFDAPGGESLDDLAARVRDVLDGLDPSGGPVVIVTHGVTSRVLRGLATGRPLRDLGALPCGQGVVHAVEKGAARLLGT
ncbi:MAG: histidine phosphatase family protein [Roseicyclus sp.]